MEDGAGACNKKLLARYVQGTTPQPRRTETDLMPNLLPQIRETLLMGPGPSCVYPEVLAALARPTLGHLDPAFIAIMDETKRLLQTLMGTQNALTLPISGTGSAGMEACFVNLVRPGDRVLILVNGVFGMRMKDVAARLGAQGESVQSSGGTPVA